MRVKEFFIIFINAFASEYLGRCYLLQRKDIVKVLINILFSQKEDTSLRQNALGAL
jgi:LisH domain-containing protein ARMC9